MCYTGNLLYQVPVLNSVCQLMKIGRVKVWQAVVLKLLYLQIKTTALTPLMEGKVKFW